MRARPACATALLIWAGGVFAAPPADDLSTRVTRLERVVESQALVEMLARIETLQQEVQQLRGKVDEQNHTLRELQRRNRELYTELERRLVAVEQGGAELPAEMPFAGDDLGTPDEQTAYQRAVELLRGLHYAQATAAFRQYLERYPRGRYAPMAQYWIGEAGFVQRDFRAAIPEYRKLVDDYPTSPKAPEALLKIATSHQELGEPEAAAAALRVLAEKYPDSPEAAQARTLLQPGKSQ